MNLLDRSIDLRIPQLKVSVNDSSWIYRKDIHLTRAKACRDKILFDDVLAELTAENYPQDFQELLFSLFLTYTNKKGLFIANTSLWQKFASVLCFQ